MLSSLRFLRFSVSPLAPLPSVLGKSAPFPFALGKSAPLPFALGKSARFDSFRCREVRSLRFRLRQLITGTATNGSSRLITPDGNRKLRGTNHKTPFCLIFFLWGLGFRV
jgi:hypothetical protein